MNNVKARNTQISKYILTKCTYTESVAMLMKSCMLKSQFVNNFPQNLQLFSLMLKWLMPRGL